ncbi:histidine kinase [Streptomyces azureus]|uniref:histidine kinase n=1 Tax=Streptomyces azureus TaxID=146537 RepID=UPI0014319001
MNASKPFHEGGHGAGRGKPARRAGHRVFWCRSDSSWPRSRLRFARDLHDLFGYSLTAVALQSEQIRWLVRSDPLRAEEESAPRPWPGMRCRRYGRCPPDTAC